MNVEHLQLARRFVLEAAGGADAVTVTLESGTPYRHYMAWVKLDTDGAFDVDVQPLFGGQNDGALVTIVNTIPNKVFQVPIEEIRPATRLTRKHPDDQALPFIMKSELLISNDAANSVQVSVYMLAAATPGGA